MDVQANAQRFDQAVSALPEKIRTALQGIPLTVRASATEVRLRVDRPVAVSSPGHCWFVDVKSQLHNIPRHCFVVTPAELTQAVSGLCSWSLHSHQKELQNGYISLRGGHRAGICGTAVTDGNTVTAVRDITSVNLRIAREIGGAADMLMEKVFDQGLCSVLVAGPPASGKTTILRDLSRQLSGGDNGRYAKVAVVDERCEIGAVHEGVPQNNLGYCADILSGYPKGVGILSAVRTMSPDVVICDEIGGGDEVDSILDGIGCGVRFIASAHAGSLDELTVRRPLMRLLKNGAFDKIVLLGGADRPGSIREIVEVEEFSNEGARAASRHTMLYDDGHVHGIRLVQTGIDD